MDTPLIKTPEVTIDIANVKRRISDDDFAVFSFTIIIDGNEVARYKESTTDGSHEVKVMQGMDAIYAKLKSHATAYYSRLSDNPDFRFELLIEDLLDRHAARENALAQISAGNIVYRKADAERGTHSLCANTGKDTEKWLVKVRAENPDCIIANEDLYAFIDSIEPLNWAAKKAA